MAIIHNQSPEAHELEVLIDKFSLANVLMAIAGIAHEKADHIETNWQDKALAREWTRAATLVDETSQRVRRMVP